MTAVTVKLNDIDTATNELDMNSSLNESRPHFLNVHMMFESLRVKFYTLSASKHRLLIPCNHTALRLLMYF